MPRTLRLAAGLALAAPLLALPPAGSPATAAEPAAPAAPAFRLWAPGTVTAYAYRQRTWTDLGLRVVAGAAPVELWSNRGSYADPISTVWRSPDGDVPLPRGSMTDFSGLRGFLHLTIDPARAGEKTVELVRKGCLNGAAERVRPTASARSPYPMGCWYNPYSLGSVQGVQAGWATPVLGQDRPLRIGPGRYTVTATVRPAYARTFGLSPDQATRTIRLRVVKPDQGEVDSATTARRPSSLRPATRPPTGPVGRTDEAGPEPDLRSLPAWGLSLSKSGAYLRFSATVWNAGDSPLVVDGFRHRGRDEMDAYQYFFDAQGEQTGYQPVGQMEWDARPSHQHWHFEDFARYSLLNADKSEVTRSKKEAFCLANTDSVDGTVPGADWRPENTDLATSCGDHSSLSIREVLVSGWGDTYTQSRAGQSFPVADLPNGTYYVAVVANPEHRLVESSTSNNVALRRIRLGGTPAHRTLTVPQVGLVSEEGYGGVG
ncbi:lysyl oxidase family protein [Nocardioides sp.]|uniref:lysyl oxidase family protein n=1 Tax=Nocardioides sp. TaxID=35761 RepID=UPI0037838E75